MGSGILEPIDREVARLQKDPFSNSQYYLRWGLPSTLSESIRIEFDDEYAEEDCGGGPCLQREGKVG